MVENPIFTPEHERIFVLKFEIKHISEAIYTYCIGVILGVPIEDWEEQDYADAVFAANRSYDKENDCYKISSNKMKKTDIRKSIQSSDSPELRRLQPLIMEQTTSVRILKNLLANEDAELREIIASRATKDETEKEEFLHIWEGTASATSKEVKLYEDVDKLRVERNEKLGHSVAVGTLNGHYIWLERLSLFLRQFLELQLRLSECSDSWTSLGGKKVEDCLEKWISTVEVLKEDKYRELEKAGGERTGVASYRFKKLIYRISRDQKDEYENLIHDLAKNYKDMRSHFLEEDEVRPFTDFLMAYWGDTSIKVEFLSLCRKLREANDKGHEDEEAVILTRIVDLLLPGDVFYIRGKAYSEKDVASKLIYMLVRHPGQQELTYENVVYRISNSAEWSPWAETGKKGVGISVIRAAYYHLFSLHYHGKNVEKEKIAERFEKSLLDFACDKEAWWDDDENVDAIFELAFAMNDGAFYGTWYTEKYNSKTRYFYSLKALQEYVINEILSDTQLDNVYEAVAKLDNDYNFTMFLKELHAETTERTL